MSAYFIFDNRQVLDADDLRRYMWEAPATVEAFGGHYRVIDGEMQVLEGDWRPRYLVLIEFPDMERAQAWYHSDLYRELRTLRLSASSASGVLVDGLPDGDNTGSANDVDYAQFNVPIIEEFRANSGKVTGTFESVDIALITSTGAKSGLPRVSPLVYVTDAGQLVIAATAAGSPKNPGWYFNLVADPEVTVEVGADQYRARAVEVKGSERDRLFAKAIQQHPRLGTYQSQTSRAIPVFALQRIDDQ